MIRKSQIENLLEQLQLMLDRAKKNAYLGLDCKEDVDFALELTERIINLLDLED